MNKYKISQKIIEHLAELRSADVARWLLRNFLNILLCLLLNLNLFLRIR